MDVLQSRELKCAQKHFERKQMEETNKNNRKPSELGNVLYPASARTSD